MNHRALKSLALAVSMLLLLTIPPATRAAALLDIAELINADGTLNVRQGETGAIDLSGWNVTLDDVRGPVATREASAVAAPSAVGWNALGTGMSSDVRALAIDSNGHVYAGGGFTAAGSCSSANGCKYIAKWDGSSWSALGTGMNDVVTAIAISGNTVYAGGRFTAAGGCVACVYIAKWSGSSWSGLDGGMGYFVRALAINGNTLIAGGEFTAAGSSCTINCRYIAKWDTSASSWSPLGSGMSYFVSALAFDASGNLYAGGDFVSAGSCTTANGCKYIAKWSNSSWSPLGTGTNNEISALAIIGNNLFAAGNFTSAGSCTSANGCNYVAKWNGSSWSALGTGTNAWTVALAIGGGNLYASGQFTTAGGCTSANGCNYIARWDGTSWSALSTGTGSNVAAIVASGSNIYAGGQFTGAGGCTSANGCNYIARYAAILSPTSITITSDGPDPSNVGQAVTIVFSVSGTQLTAPASVRAPSQTGLITVTSSDGKSCQGSLTEANGISTGSCSITFATAGAKSLTASYPGDSTYGSSVSSAAAHQVNSLASEVPEGDTLLLLASGIGGLGVWLRYQMNKRRN